jgi:hypothetical protein
VFLALVLWKGNQRQQAEAAERARKLPLQVALLALGKGAPVAPAGKNGVEAGTRYEPAPPSGPQRVVE